MLQQTQVSTVLPYYAAWLGAFPDVGHLAHADEEQVLRLWEGLGYYSRARNLHRAAKIVAEELGGVVPSDPARFRDLPGVGAYSCAAVMSIAFDHDLAVVDGNVRRVLSRLLALELDPRSTAARKLLQQLAQDLLPAGTAAVHNQAMMELGARVCTPRGPRCDACPLSGPCLARRDGAPERFPPRAPRPPIPHRRFVVGLVLDRHARVLIHRRPPGGLLGGLWEFPRVKLHDADPGQTLIGALRRDLGLSITGGEWLSEVTHAYSHFQVTLEPYLCTAHRPTRAAETDTLRWIPPAALDEHPMSTADRKLMRLLRQALEQQVNKSTA